MVNSELYPFQSRFLDLGGLRYHYLDEGRGEPVVMVHGNPTWSFYWRELIKALRSDFRCIAPDHIGCGLSDKPGDDRYEYTLERRVGDLEALLDHLGLHENITLVVHDWGGMIGMAAAVRRPERFSRFVVLNTAAFLLPPSKRLPWRLRVLHRRSLWSELAVRGLNLFSWPATWMATAKGLPPEVKAGLMAPYDSWANRIAIARFVQDIPTRPGHRSYDLAKWVDDNLHVLRGKPMLICWGAKDFVFDDHFLDEWRRRFPEAEVHRFPDAGHYVMEDVAPQIISLVAGFLGKPATAGRNAGRCDTDCNVAAYLPQMAERQPEVKAIIWPTGRNAHGRIAYSHLTFRQLNGETDRYARGLEHAGIGRGMRTILMVRPSIEFFVLTFALYKIGAVPILIDPGMGKRRMIGCLATISAEAFIGIPTAHVLRITNRRAFRTVRVAVTVGRRWAWGGRRLADVRSDDARPYDMAPTGVDDPAAIIFTTGSTGPPKAVLFRHGNFDAQVRILREHFHVQPGDVDLPTFPLFALFDPALGMTAVVPDMDPTRPAEVDPTKIIEAIRDQGVTHMFGSPALLDRVSRYGEANGVTLPTLRRVISAGAPAPPATLERFAKMLTGEAEIHTPYGATEALPIASIGSREILGETRHETAKGGGTCVGRPLPGVTLRIIRISDEPIEEWSDELVLPAGEIGEIVVKGPMVTREYLADDRANSLAKIQDGDDVWHRMGDVGRLDERGRLWFYGRKVHRVQTRQGTLFTDPVEAVFNEHPAVFRSALVGLGKPPNQQPVVCVQRENGSQLGDATLFAELRELGRAHDHTRAIERFLVHPAFPVDIRHNSKIFREKLAVWVTEQLA